MDTVHKQPQTKALIAAFFLSSLLLTSLLGYIDEGRYSFEGLWTKENTPALIMYAVLFLGAKLLIAKAVFRNYKGKYKILLSILALLAFLLTLILLCVVSAYIDQKVS
jgi:hypothetical protein